MNFSEGLKDLANNVGNDYSASAPDDASKLIGKARRSRVVWGSKVGTIAVAGAATLAFGGPAVAAVVSGDTQMEPATVATIVSESPTSEAETSIPVVTAPAPAPAPAPEVSITAPANPGVIDLTGGVTANTEDDGDNDDIYEDSEDREDHEDGEDREDREDHEDPEDD